ncbi:hypothetical protein Dimus_016871 [Dionaea muscipula]
MLQSHFVPRSDVMYEKHGLPVCKAGNHENDVNQELENKDSRGYKLHPSNILYDLGPQALRALHELVDMVHDHVNVGDQPQQPTSAHNVGIISNMGSQDVALCDLYSLQDDPIAKILWNTGPSALRSAFLAMAQKFPRTLETLILHLLTPTGAEVLTRKFDELDQQMTEEERSKFYQDFYSVFDDQYLAMDAILNGKESFARQVNASVGPQLFF